MEASEVTLTYLLDTYRTKQAIAEKFGVTECSVFSWFKAGMVPLRRQNQYISNGKKCPWCGEPVPMTTNAIYCTPRHAKIAYKDALSQQKIKALRYGTQAFDAWVDKSWQGSDRRGHAITA